MLKKILKRAVVDKKNIGYHLIEDDKLYEHEKREYRLFMENVKTHVFSENRLEYLSFFIDLLIKELKYSCLLEINRHGCRERFFLPFSEFDLRFLNLPEREIEIDIQKNNLISVPWKHNRYEDILKKLKNEPFEYDPENHKARYYDYINLTCAYNGLHSLGAGSYMGEGKITADFVDTTKIFPFINVENDLSFTYNQNAVRAFFEKGDMPLDLEKNLDIRVYGTDYRLVLIYELAKRKYCIEKGVYNGIYK